MSLWNLNYLIFDHTRASEYFEYKQLNLIETWKLKVRLERLKLKIKL